MSDSDTESISNKEETYDAFNQFLNGNSYKIIDWILDGKVDKDSCDDDHGESLLHWALRHHIYKLAEFLVKQGCDVNLIAHSDGQTALDMVRKDGEMYKLLLSKGAKTSDELCEEEEEEEEKNK
jgi:ankyrin repeat protein